MAIPKSHKLLRQQQDTQDWQMPPAPPQQESPLIRIQEIHCLNDFVAVLRLRHQSVLQMPDASKYKNEGVVVGIGPGLPGDGGDRRPRQLRLGDVVMFMDRNVVTEFEPHDGPYRGHRIAIISERSLLCKLKPVPFEIVNEVADDEELQASG